MPTHPQYDQPVLNFIKFNEMMKIDFVRMENLNLLKPQRWYACFELENQCLLMRHPHHLKKKLTK